MTACSAIGPDNRRSRADKEGRAARLDARTILQKRAVSRSMKGGLVPLGLEEPRGSRVLDDEDDGEAGRPSEKI